MTKEPDTMTSAQRKQKSRTAAKLGLVAAPRGYVRPATARFMAASMAINDKLLKTEMENTK